MKSSVIATCSLLFLLLISSCEKDSPAAVSNPTVAISAAKDSVPAGNTLLFTAVPSVKVDSIFWKLDGIATEETGWVAGDSDTAIVFSTIGTATVHVKVVLNSKTATASFPVRVLANPLSLSLTGTGKAVVQNGTLNFTATAGGFPDSLLWKIGGTATDLTGWVRGDSDTTLAFSSVGVSPVFVKAVKGEVVKTTFLNVTCYPKAGTKVRYVGSRSSYYGFDPFPKPEAIASVYQKMAAKIPGSIPSAVWIVGGIKGSACDLEFPRPGTTTYPNITFQNQDKHEAYLDEFDKIGAKVFLQVEAGMADMKTLMKLVIGQYRHHQCIAGFGIDVEWYPSPLDKNGDSVGTMDEWKVVSNVKAAITQAEIAELDAYVKTFDPFYRIFLKHWEPNMCGSKSYGDAVYLNSSQRFKSIDQMIGSPSQSWTTAGWANAFKPGECGYQIGYEDDAVWWKLLKDPLVDITKKLDTSFPNQINHIYWVDFTMYDPMLTEYWK